VPTRLNPYLHFQGNAREAMETYQRALGGELIVTTFAEGGAPHDPSDAAKVMHAQLETAKGHTLMGADTPTGQPAAPISGISMSLSGDDDAELSQAFEGLQREGATVVEPLVEAPWGDKFGILADPFGVTWFVNVTRSPAPTG
jgi:PhnB protein